jgi:hypothetical protein
VVISGSLRRNTTSKRSTELESSAAPRSTRFEGSMDRCIFCLIDWERLKRIL